jgi:mono/diheme cytochrome c family protein
MQKKIIIAVAALAVLGSLPVVLAQQPSWDGAYTAAQAKRGEALYNGTCIMCHSKDLAGGDRAPALAGAGFAARWKSRPLAELLDYTQTQMPLQGPGGLTRHQTADILAFVLMRNGATAGAKDFWTDGPEGGSPALKRSPDYLKVATPSTRKGEAFFTEDQARRGKLAFNRNCAFCHTVDPRTSTPADLLAALPSTFGGHFLERVVNGKTVYPNVLMLYSKLLSMPAFNTKAVSAQQRVDIAAYILQANGYPSGGDEIPADVDAMRQMTLNEPGFERIFNGKDFAGWNFNLGANCREAPDGCGKTVPGDVLRVEAGMIVCECHVHGIFYTDKKYKDFTLRFDYRFEKPEEFAPEDDEELYSGGGGYLIFSDIGAPGYPKSIEVEGRHRDIAEYYAIGGPGKIGDVDLEAKRRVMRPLGQWNSLEIMAKGGRIVTSLNGVPVSKVDKHDYNYAGNIAFQVQGRKMAYRNIRIKAE